MRPFQVGTFDGYLIEPCETAKGPRGHVVRGTRSHDPGEAASPERVESYRDKYLLPRLKDTVSITGFASDATCARSGMTIFVDFEGPDRLGEALHVVGEVLRDQPTDIEVVIVRGKP